MASKSFIDLSGLTHYDEKLNEKLDAKYVSLTGSQTISGTKTFTASPAVSMPQPIALLTNSNLTKGTNPSSNTYGNIMFQDKTSTVNMVKRAGSLDFGVNTSGQTEVSMRAFDWGQETNTNGAISIYYPKSGTPYTAAPTPASSDNSTKIATTAFVKAQGYLTSHQSLSNYVTLDTAQTITGAKTFTSDISLNSRQINSASCIEFKPTSATANHGGYLDFHFNQSNADYTSRIIESASGTLSINNVTITSGKVVTATTFSGTLSGNASTATKLTTARTISAGDLEFQGSASFDGSGNANLNITQHRCIASNGNTNYYPFHRIAYIPTLTGNYQDRGITLLISRDYSGGGWGICRIILRTNNATSGGTASLNVQWLVRSSELPADSIQAGFCNAANASYVDVFYKSHGGYNSAVCRVLAHTNSRASIGRGFTLLASSNEVSNTTTEDPKTSVESYATIAAAGTTLHSQNYTSTIVASDVGVVGSATKATQDASGNVITATYATKSELPDISAIAASQIDTLFA